MYPCSQQHSLFYQNRILQTLSTLGWFARLLRLHPLWRRFVGIWTQSFQEKRQEKRRCRNRNWNYVNLRWNRRALAESCEGELVLEDMALFHWIDPEFNNNSVRVLSFYHSQWNFYIRKPKDKDDTRANIFQRQQ
jgi:hypothetical protein